MATGGIFQLITNDGRQDRMLMATSLLKRRLDSIQDARAQEGLDPTPTLVDIEKTHILFTNAHFKPFAAIGYEYNKVQSSSGSPSLGSTIQFSVPQFGDFFHDMVLHVKLQQPAMTVTAVAVADQPAMRWCAFPGERLMGKVQFEVNGNPLDEYTSSVYNFYREYCVPPHKKTGWYRCVGQELPHKGFSQQPDWINSISAPAEHRYPCEVYNGHQTPTGQKSVLEAGDVELFVPLLFWFNKDPRLSVPSVAIPYGQRFINIELATQQELVGLVPRGLSTFAAPGGSLDRTSNIVRKMELYINNIFVNPEIHDIFIKRIGFTLIRIHRQQTNNVTKTSDDILLQQLKWPIETLFAGIKMKDHTSTTAATQSEHLDKWHTFSKVDKTSFANAAVVGSRVQTLTQTTLAVAAGAVTGVGTAFTLDPSTGLVAVTLDLAELRIGDVLVAPTGEEFTVTVVGTATNATVSDAVTGVGAVIGWTIRRSAPAQCTVDVHSATMDVITIKAHGIPIYNEFPSAFYNAYVPLHYGGPNIQTPEDMGMMMINFCLYPGTYQPSGHINVSRAREFYLTYTSSVVGNTAPGPPAGVSFDGVLVVVASAINFLLISDGSAVLRYST
jgi:hypothetical protein